ncbi:uncharacterized protein LOC124149688 isoform X2 [Haliotis rufescens]|uniref:uncharacterized protein LOC124149688 isoform X2 n=1 Tax=Haliotis rufescens TaxID=6454 RepID=UPI00201F05A6|nr:uncharacterized protein LOC124149688 isoform X2 [Haliotis rufescens]XP_048254117.1 uncharacterized protein LOC124149688 isoform X2 [Haliotis rufescens]XP_048254118.1 uncharacterized protein LOC124149688 isoform X2 [Haliotis rufescens]XP_048254119.1 uncharacterized protein LOC124149688 isoform X2 [Haliotis rufescens]
MGVTGKSDSLGLYILLGTLLPQLSQGAAELVCPEVGFLDSPANLSCSGTGRTHSYIQPSGGIVTTCNMTTATCIPDVMVTIPNSSYSVLTLPRVNQSHAGRWTCSIWDYVTGCFMTVAKLPSCAILSNRSAEEVTVRVQDYHCSDSTELYLKTGNVPGRLLNTSRINTIVDMIEITVNVTTSLVESKTLAFVCGNTSWEIACQEPPSCDILSNRSAEEVTVRVQDYHCSDSIELYLKTGNFTGRLLNTSRINTTGGMFEITVNVTTSLVETKTLVFVCGNTSWEIACQELPSCDILSNRSAEEVTVRVQDYHCSDSIELYLKTGHLTGRLLNVQRTATPVGMFEITVNVATSLAETKKLVFVCGNTSWDIACQEQVTADSRRGGSITSAVVVGAVVAGSVAVTIIFVLVVVLVKMKQSKRTQKPETHSGRNVYDSPNDVDGQTDETAGHEYTTLNRTPIEGGSIYNVISS